MGANVSSFEGGRRRSRELALCVVAVPVQHGLSASDHVRCAFCIVNGIVATVAGDKVFAPVQLNQGLNTLTAVVTTPEGITAAHQIEITADGVAPSTEIQATETEGVDRLEVVFSLRGVAPLMGSVGVQGGQVTAVQEGDAIRVTYPSAGIYTTTIQAIDSLGAATSKEFMVVVHDKASMDAILQASWSAFKAALVSGGASAALNYVSEAVRSRYAPVFDALSPHMSQITDSFINFQSTGISSNVATYAVNRNIDGIRYIFFVYFTKGEDGVWRIEAM